MTEFGTIWRMAVAVLAVWRLSRLLFQDQAGSEVRDGIRCGLLADGPRAGGAKPEGLLAGRFMDLLYWLHVWLSAQTAVWVACGFAGVFVGWVAASGVSRAFAIRAGLSPMALSDPGDSRGHVETPDGLQEAAQ